MADGAIVAMAQTFPGDDPIIRREVSHETGNRHWAIGKGRGAMKRWFRVQQIGVVLRPDDPGGEDNTFFDPAAESTIEIDERWADGLEGIEEFSHIVVMFY